jgi:hypothetical protein
MATQVKKPRKAILSAALKTPSPIPTPAAVDIDAAMAAEHQVNVFVPAAFIFTRDDHSELKVRAGLQKMPQSMTEHWYVKSLGVQVQAD